MRGAAVESRTLGQAIDLAARDLAAAGITGPRHEARLLVGHATALKAEQLLAHPDRTIDTPGLRRLRGLVRRRASRQPMAQVLGHREFWSLTFKVTEAVLAPRPESETVVEAALAAAVSRSGRDAPRRILDLGTGTGCLLLALLEDLPGARGVGVDISAAAVAVARENARCLGLAARARFMVGDWGRALGGQFDVIVANPPYIPDQEIAGLQPEVRCFEPRLALTGGADGLDAFHAIGPDIARLLAPGGFVALEIGAGQAEAVSTMLRDAGLGQIRVHADLAGRPRCAVASAPDKPMRGKEETSWKSVG